MRRADPAPTAGSGSLGPLLPALLTLLAATPLRAAQAGTRSLGPERSPDVVQGAAPGVGAGTAPPMVTLLYQNFPNPFPRPDLGEVATRIWFDLARPAAVELAVYDLRGRLVRRLIPAAGCGRVQLAPGLYGREDPGGDPCILTRWDGRDDAGRQVPRGVYILRLRAGDARQTRRILFLPDGS